MQNSLDDQSLIVIHILNKRGALGGIEMLLQTALEDSTQLTLEHRTMFIADSYLSRWLLRMHILRIIALFWGLVRIALVTFSNRINHKKVSLVFHSAEAHFLAYLLASFTKLSRNIKIVNYLHQSPNLYPRKLRKYILSQLAKGVPSISYSSRIRSAWNIQIDEANGIVIHAIPRQIKSPRLGSLQPPKNRINLLFVGRDVYWKRLDFAIEFSLKIKREEIPVSLYVIGGRAAELNARWAHKSRDLEIHFLGQQESIDYASCDFLLVPCDYEDSREIVGIAGFESILQKTPILIRDLDFTDFSHFPGVYSFDTVLHLIKVAPSKRDAIALLKSLRLTDLQLAEYWNQTLSRNRYIDQFEAFIISLHQ
jgi:glycosyltransferase involved in cell wall biosynthesis